MGLDIMFLAFMRGILLSYSSRGRAVKRFTIDLGRGRVSLDLMTCGTMMTSTKEG